MKSSKSAHVLLTSICGKYFPKDANFTLFRYSYRIHQYTKVSLGSGGTVSIPNGYTEPKSLLVVVIDGKIPTFGLNPLCRFRTLTFDTLLDVIVSDEMSEEAPLIPEEVDVSDRSCLERETLLENLSKEDFSTQVVKLNIH